MCSCNINIYWGGGGGGGGFGGGHIFFGLNFMLLQYSLSRHFVTCIQPQSLRIMLSLK